MHSIEPRHFRRPWMTFQDHCGDLLTVVTLYAQLTRDLLAMAKFLTSLTQSVSQSVSLFRQ